MNIYCERRRIAIEQFAALSNLGRLVEELPPTLSHKDMLLRFSDSDKRNMPFVIRKYDMQSFDVERFADLCEKCTDRFAVFKMDRKSYELEHDKSYHSASEIVKFCRRDVGRVIWSCFDMSLKLLGATEEREPEFMAKLNLVNASIGNDIYQRAACYLVGGKGGFTPPHYDAGAGSLQTIKLGQKLWFFWPFKDAFFLEALKKLGEPESTYVFDDNLFKNCLVLIVNPGDTYYLPLGAPHMVITPEFSVVASFEVITLPTFSCQRAVSRFEREMFDFGSNLGRLTFVICCAGLTKIRLMVDEFVLLPDGPKSLVLKEILNLFDLLRDRLERGRHDLEPSLLANTEVAGLSYREIGLLMIDIYFEVVHKFDCCLDRDMAIGGIIDGKNKTFGVQRVGFKYDHVYLVVNRETGARFKVCSDWIVRICIFFGRKGRRYNCVVCRAHLRGDATHSTKIKMLEHILSNPSECIYTFTRIDV